MRVAAFTPYQQRAASLGHLNTQAEMVSENLMTEEREEHVLLITILPLTRRYSLDFGGGTP